MALIEVENFKKSFGDKNIHDGVSFFVRKGECMGLVGGSGAGKSVILRSLIGLERPDSGDIRINDKSIIGISELAFTEVRKKVAYAFQGGALFDSMTVRENLSYPLEQHTSHTASQILDRVKNQLNEFGLLDALDLFPGELSGGMQKRVGLARAMMLEPEILLYDEPTAGLDPYNTIKIQELIVRLKEKGVTSILVTHDIPTALNVCDKIAFLKNKIIAEQGTIEQLQEQIKNRTEGLINQFMQGRVV